MIFLVYDEAILLIPRKGDFHYLRPDTFFFKIENILSERIFFLSSCCMQFDVLIVTKILFDIMS